MSKSDKKIVVIGGGTGIFTVLSGLREYFSNLTAIVTMADDGGSSGILREDFGILPPGDIRRALIALADSDNKILSALFNYRFQEGSGLSGHSFGNLLITALERLTGSFEKAIGEAARILAIKGKVVPIALIPTRLVAQLEDGQIIRGESRIDIPLHDGSLAIEKIWLEPLPKINSAAKKEILAADLIIFGPGDLYTSVIPNLLVKGVRQAVRQSRGKKIYFVNLMTKFGETHNFKASDFLKTMEEYLGRDILNYVAINKNTPNPKRLRPYISENAALVEIDKENFSKKPVLIQADFLRSKGLVRHDPQKIARFVKAII